MLEADLIEWSLEHGFGIGLGVFRRGARAAKRLS